MLQMGNALVHRNKSLSIMQSNSNNPDSTFLICFLPVFCDLSFFEKTWPCPPSCNFTSVHLLFVFWMQNSFQPMVPSPQEPKHLHKHDIRRRYIQYSIQLKNFVIGVANDW